MSLNTLLLLVHETLSLDLGVQTLGGLHGQHNEAVFSANWFNRHALSNNTLLSVLTRVNAETRKGCQSVIASTIVINTLLSLRWIRCGSNLSSDTRWMLNAIMYPKRWRAQLVPSVRTLVGLHGQHHVYVLFLCRRKALSNTRW